MRSIGESPTTEKYRIFVAPATLADNFGKATVAGSKLGIGVATGEPVGEESGNGLAAAAVADGKGRGPDEPGVGAPVARASGVSAAEFALQPPTATTTRRRPTTIATIPLRLRHHGDLTARCGSADTGGAAELVSIAS